MEDDEQIAAAGPIKSIVAALSADRAGIISAVQTPLGYISLFTLCVQPILALIIYTYRDAYLQMIIAIGVLILWFLSLATVVWMALRPAAVAARAVDDRAAGEIQKGHSVVILKPLVRDVRSGDGIIVWNARKMDRHVGRVARVIAIDRKAQVARLDIDFGDNDWSFSWLYGR